MFENSHVKKLIIVCDEKTKECANYLMQLISVNDDKEDQVIGTKDGSVDAVVWMEKDYIANQPTLSSSAYVLFIGNNKTAKSQMSHINKLFNKYNMYYGWLGKRAVMWVDKPISKKNEYQDFINFAKDHQNNITNVLGKHKHAGTVGGVTGAATSVLAKTTTPVLTIMSVGLFAPIASIAAAFAGPFAIINIAKKQKINSEILKQQYSCLTLVMYLEGLHEFLGD